MNGRFLAIKAHIFMTKVFPHKEQKHENWCVWVNSNHNHICDCKPTPKKIEKLQTINRSTDDNWELINKINEIIDHLT